MVQKSAHTDIEAHADELLLDHLIKQIFFSVSSNVN